jgi:uncharacterized membrane protein
MAKDTHNGRRSDTLAVTAPLLIDPIVTQSLATIRNKNIQVLRITLDKHKVTFAVEVSTAYNKL